MAKFTKQAIVSGFLQILRTKSFDKITVKDICELCEINRNTFYYYFKDIYDVLDALFEIESQSVIEDVKEGASFYEEYARRAAIILNNREAVIHIYESKNGAVMRKCLDNVTSAFVGRFVEEKAEGYSLSGLDLNFITSFYSNAIVGITIKWIENGMKKYDKDIIKRISDSFEATIYDMIECCMQ